MKYKGLWICFGLVNVVSLAVLGYYGGEIYRLAPPVPDRVATPDGAVIRQRQEIKDVQNVWQSSGGQQLGSIWGHGAYVAPDWSADWLHRECLWLLGDTVVAVGIMGLAWFVVGLKMGWSVMREADVVIEAPRLEPVGAGASD